MVFRESVFSGFYDSGKQSHSSLSPAFFSAIGIRNCFILSWCVIKVCHQSICELWFNSNWPFFSVTMFELAQPHHSLNPRDKIHVRLSWPSSDVSLVGLLANEKCERKERKRRRDWKKRTAIVDWMAFTSCSKKKLQISQEVSRFGWTALNCKFLKKLKFSFVKIL